ncbi:MAG: SpoIIE family protein phosphatase [Gammaproteobacteria bacterium]|nr:MAG: SpoIIE family protein phosphatase [Gammaproteobacteria bacterium]
MNLQFGTWVRPMFGEPSGGDLAVVRDVGEALLVAIVDVLGHGAEANVVAKGIAEYLNDTEETDLLTIIETLHARLKGGRGAAVGLARILPDKGEMEYVGVGNTAARRVWRRATRLVSKDGTVGAHLRRSTPQTLQLDCGDTLLFYTDGVKDRFELADYRHLISDTPSSIARNIVELFGKDYDDAACIAVKVGRQ